MSDSTPASAGQSFKALATLPELGGGFKPGHITVRSGKLRFEGEAGAVEWSLEEIQLNLGGHDDLQLFLSRAADPKAAITTRDLTLLDLPAFQHSRLRDQIGRARKRSKAIPVGLFGCGTVVLLLLVGLIMVFAMRARISAFLAEKVPIEWEVEYGRTALKQLSTQEKIITNHVAFNAQVRVVTNALLPALGATKLPFQFHIIENTNLNAFAVPGGQVFIFTGLLTSAKRPEELAGVLAHEIAHITHRHSMRNIISSAGLGLTISALIGDAQGVTALLADSSQFLLNQKFSRDFEREADDTGWDYLLAANVDPRGMIEFFQTMKDEQERSTAGKLANTLDFLSTHPATDERMKHLRAKWDKLPRKSGFTELRTGLAE